MRSTSWRILVLVLCILFIGIHASSALAGGHTWRVKEIFSNADGTVQFIEVWEAFGGAGETATAGHDVTSNSNSFTIPNNVPAPTSFRSLLLATQAFADLNVVTPDYIIPENFFSLTSDSITYTPFHTVSFLPGMLPTDGVLSLNADLTTGVNSPQNYAGDTGSVDLSVQPPGVPATGADPLTVAKIDSFPDASRVRVFYDTATCEGNAGHQMLYGMGTLLPSSPGGTYGLTGARCTMTGNPFTWSGVPDPSADATKLLWFLVQATNGSTTEGSWGKDSAGTERDGPGADGSSGQCGMTTKDLSNTCGQ